MSTMHPVPDYCSPPIPAELSGSNHDKGSCDPRKGGSFSTDNVMYGKNALI